MKALLFLFLGLLHAGSLPAMEYAQPSAKMDSVLARPIRSLAFSETPLPEVVRLMGKTLEVNLVCSKELNIPVTITLYDLPLKSFLEFLESEYPVLVRVKNGVIHLVNREKEGKPEDGASQQLTVHGDSLWTQLRKQDLRTFLETLSVQAKRTYLYEPGLSGKLDGIIQGMPLDKGLSVLLQNNGFQLVKEEDHWLVKRDMLSLSDPGQKATCRISYSDSLVSLEAVGTDMGFIIRKLAADRKLSIHLPETMSHKVNLTVQDLALEKVFDYLVQGTPYTYAKLDGIYFFGDKKDNALQTTRLVKLQHIKVEGIEARIPKSLSQLITTVTIQELNGLVLIGNSDEVNAVERFLREIDQTIAQILFDVLVVEFSETQGREFQLKAGRGEHAAVVNPNYFPNLELEEGGEFWNTKLNILGPKWGLSNLGNLPSDFYLQLKMLESEGVLNVQSRPRLATLNGNPASLSVGSTSYYKMITEIAVPNTGGETSIRTTERFEKIEADVTLELTPWVSGSGEITTNIKPDFRIPGARLSQDIPPDISHKTFSSTVRLRDGETIILGGLSTVTENENSEGFPIISRIPFLGRLFRNSNKTKEKKELIIYVTPHLYYDGGGRIELPPVSETPRPELPAELPLSPPQSPDGE